MESTLVGYLARSSNISKKPTPVANELAATQENWSFWGYDLVRHELVCTVKEEEQKLLDLKELHYPFSENKGADQLCLCFGIDKILFSFFFFFFFF